MNQWNKPPLGSQIDPGHPLSRGLVGCWLMNEGSGNRISDLSGNGNHGVLTNGPRWKPGQCGGSVAFDGVNDFVNCGAYTILNLQAEGTLIISAQILNWAGSGLYWGIAAKGAYAGFDRNGYGFWYYGGATDKLFATIANRTPVDRSEASINLGSSIVLGNIAHTFGLSWNQTKVYGYVDGISKGSKNYAFGAGSTLTVPFYLGRNEYTALMNGIVYYCMIYNRALSAQEVADLYVNPYGFIHQPRKYWLMPQGVTIPPHLLFRRAAA